MNFSYKKLQSTEPIAPSEVDFEELEQILDVEIDEVAREAVIKFDSLRKYLAWKKKWSALQTETALSWTSDWN